MTLSSEFNVNNHLRTNKLEYILIRNTLYFLTLFSQVTMVAILEQTLENMPRLQQKILNNKKFRFHLLRHYHATSLIESGASIKDVQERLGHMDILSTECPRWRNDNK